MNILIFVLVLGLGIGAAMDNGVLGLMIGLVLGALMKVANSPGRRKSGWAPEGDSDLEKGINAYWGSIPGTFGNNDSCGSSGSDGSCGS